jgi:hypothetical protein
MTKSHASGNKEAKKPNDEKPKGEASAYKQSQRKGSQALIPPGKKGWLADTT